MTSKITEIKPDEKDTLSVNRNKGKVKFSGTLLRYRDKDTRQMVYLLPSLDITGYGATEEKAREMLDFSVDEFFRYLITLPADRIDAELKRLKWDNVPFASKQYSQMSVNQDGELDGFNAVADQVERLTLQV
jgi:hypothetical protein